MAGAKRLDSAAKCLNLSAVGWGASVDSIRGEVNGDRCINDTSELPTFQATKSDAI